MKSSTSYKRFYWLLLLCLIILLPLTNKSALAARRYNFQDYPRYNTLLTMDQLLKSDGECQLIRVEHEKSKDSGFLNRTFYPYVDVSDARWNISEFVRAEGHPIFPYTVNDGGFTYEFSYEAPVLCLRSWVENQGLVKGETRTKIITSQGTKFIIKVLSWIIVLFGRLGLSLIELVTKFMVAMATAATFSTHPFVVKGWPFIQGIANIGFILALLVIAAATTLRIESFNVRRLLPRLLIAALLINFSLVIGAVLIDSSRVVMAIEIGLYKNDKGQKQDMSKLATQILKNSGLPEELSQFTVPGDHSWSIPLGLLTKAILIWGLVIGIVYMAVLLFVRYVALLILLVLSPLAYLASVLPKTAPIAQTWWTQFIKWTLYGPILLLFLILISFSGDIIDKGKKAGTFGSFANIAIVSGMLIAAGKIGSSLGGAGASAAVGFTTRRLNQARRGSTGASKYVGKKVYEKSGAKDAVENYKKSSAERSKQSYIRRKGAKIGKSLGGSRTVAGTSGAAKGAVVGAAIGSAVPIVGTAVGGAAGTAAGAFIGSRRTKKEKDILKKTNDAQAAIKNSMSSGTSMATEAAVQPTNLGDINIERLEIDELKHAVMSDKTNQAQKEALLKRPEVAEKLLKEDPETINQILSKETTAPDDLRTNYPPSKNYDADDLNDQNRKHNREAKQLNENNKSLIKSLNKGLDALNKKNAKDDGGGSSKK